MARLTICVAQLGARMHYAVPRILHERDMLERFFTDSTATAPWASVLRVMPERLRGLGELGSVLVAEMCGLAVTAISLALLLKPMGIMGAAIASILGYATTFVVALYCGTRATGLSLTTLAGPRADEIVVTARLIGVSSFRFFHGW
jgi:Na+-driven multidrug efflux pump